MCEICTIDYLIHRVKSHNSGTTKLKIVDIRTTIPNNLEQFEDNQPKIKWRLGTQPFYNNLIFIG
jgi:hypothetical protein